MPHAVKQSVLPVLISAAALNVLSGCQTYTERRAAALYELSQTSIGLVEEMAIANRNSEAKMTESEMSIIAIQNVRNLLKDPNSAQIRKVYRNSFGSGFVYCGEVNGKNAYGGYVGFKPFVSGVNDALIHSDNKNPEIELRTNMGLYKACGLLG